MSMLLFICYKTPLNGSLNWYTPAVLLPVFKAKTNHARRDPVLSGYHTIDSYPD